MLIKRITKIIAGLRVLAARLGSVSYADHPAAGDQAVSDPSRSQTYVPLPPGR